jgi:hypothetical protein
VFCPLSGNANTAYFSGDKLVSECSGNAFVPPAIIAAGVNHGDISGVLCLEKPAGEAVVIAQFFHGPIEILLTIIGSLTLISGHFFHLKHEHCAGQD